MMEIHESASTTLPTDPDRRELEWQMDTTDLDGLRHWAAGHPVSEEWLVEPRPSLELRDTYLDTEDWRIHRAGMALRVRDAPGHAEATLKELHSARSDIADRRELSEPLPAGQIDALSGSTGPVGERVRAVTGTHPLRALFVAHTSRQRFGLRRQDSPDDLGELALDETIITDAAGLTRTTLQRVEVEAFGTDSAPLASFVSALRRDCAVETATDSKYAFGLKSAGLAPPLPPALREINRTMRTDEVGFAALSRYLAMWRAHESAARLGEDPEALHDLRTAGRRMEVTLGLFASDLPASLVRLRPRLKQVVGALGATRDLDVALAGLDRYARTLAPSERAALDPVRRRLDAERTRERTRLLRTLDAVGTQRCLERLERAVAAPPASRKQPSHAPAIAVLPPRLRSRYRKLRKALARLTPDSPVWRIVTRCVAR